MILHEFIQYDTLRLIWWGLLGVLLIGFGVMGGLDLGVGMLLPFAGRSDVERRVVINSVGPTWEGNQVWLILGGGAIFAAWPPLYAVSFSGFYLAMFAVLLALIVRPVGFKFRSKRDEPAWRSRWDWTLFLGGFVPSLIFGVAVGNVLQGVPFRLSDELRITYEGGFLDLLNPFALLCGLLSVAMLVMHGAGWLLLKTAGPVAERARRYGGLAALATIVLFVAGGLWLAFGSVDAYRVTSELDRLGPSNPLRKVAVMAPGAWLDNYRAHPLLWAAPALGVLGAALAWLGLRARRELTALAGSSASVLGIILTVGVSMFPFLLPSSADPRASLTVWDASSSHLTLFIMLVATAIFIPLIVAYTTWVYRVLWGKVDEASLADPQVHSY
ncbi:MAG: cytochrome d ubiquinol oxidase subunit II [Aquincola tertiaricarbonis]|uniref:cytochrome d ubiquinol oxidase subunit II n=1 Tax=Aquincola tertiaricarbonis TaxID=391953 RepID=UPI000614ABBD|nr:cytochrome d ubiquinol oxidase subunit II [Aquincola tertiaricarbonis]